MSHLSSVSSVAVFAVGVWFGGWFLPATSPGADGDIGSASGPPTTQVEQLAIGRISSVHDSAKTVSQVGQPADFPELQLGATYVHNRSVEAARVSHFGENIVHTTLTHRCPMLHGVVQYSRRQMGEFTVETHALGALQNSSNSEISSLMDSALDVGVRSSVSTNLGRFDLVYFNATRSGEENFCAAFAGYPGERTKRVVGYLCSQGPGPMTAASTKHFIEALELSGVRVKVNAA